MPVKKKLISSYKLPKKDYAYSVYISIVNEDRYSYNSLINLRDYELPEIVDLNYFEELKRKSELSRISGTIDLLSSDFYKKGEGYWKIIEVENINNEPFKDILALWCPVSTKYLLDKEIYNIDVELFHDDFEVSYVIKSMKESGNLSTHSMEFPLQNSKTGKMMTVYLNYYRGIPQGPGGLYEPKDNYVSNEGDLVTIYEIIKYYNFKDGINQTKNVTGGVECLTRSIVGSSLKDSATSAIVTEVVASLIFGSSFNSESINQSYLLNELKKELKNEGYNKEAEALNYGEFIQCLHSFYFGN